MKLNIMPLCMCSAMWQWAIHRPGLVTSKQNVHGLAIADQHRVLPDQVGLGHPVAGQHQEPPGAVQVEGVLHGMVHVVDQPDLDPVAFGEVPADRGVGGAGRRVNQLPAQVGRSGQPVGLRLVIFPLDAASRALAMVAAVVILGATGERSRLSIPGWLSGPA